MSSTTRKEMNKWDEGERENLHSLFVRLVYAFKFVLLSKEIRES